MYINQSAIIVCLHLCTSSLLTAGWFPETLRLSDHHVRQTSDSEPGTLPVFAPFTLRCRSQAGNISLRFFFYSPGKSERLRKAAGTGLCKDGGQSGQRHDQVSR